MAQHPYRRLRPQRFERSLKWQHFRRRQNIRSCIWAAPLFKADESRPPGRCSGALHSRAMMGWLLFAEQVTHHSIGLAGSFACWIDAYLPDTCQTLSTSNPQSAYAAAYLSCLFEDAHFETVEADGANTSKPRAAAPMGFC